jgi:hypothetical protein
MGDEDLIKRVLDDYPLYYLIYRGGSGGEFLSYLISKYSPKFRKIASKKLAKDVNRTHIHLPNFFESLSRARSNSLTQSDLITELLTQFRNRNENVKHITEEAVNFLNSDTAPLLIRCHMTTNPYFNVNNSYWVLADNEVWHNYAGILLFIKVLNTEHHINSLDDVQKIFTVHLDGSANDSKRYNNIKNGMNWAIQNNVKTITGIQTSIIAWGMDLDNTLTYNEIFNSTPIEVYKKYAQLHSYNEYVDLNQVIIDKGNLIRYSNLFVKGYLEEMFSINSNSFHNELIGWHNNNLDLMSEFNFDTTPYLI